MADIYAFGWRLLQGLGVTFAISFTSMLIALVGGLLFGFLMTLPNRFLRFFCRFYLELIRFVPILVWLFIFYFSLAAWGDWHWPAYVVCILVFSLWGIAEMGDLVRGALTSIDKHQSETAFALGLSKAQVFLWVLLPQSIRRVLPGVVNLLTRMVKTTALAALIGVVEVVKVAQQIIELHPWASFWIYGVVFIMYFIVCYPLSLLSAYLEQKEQQS
ncbi:MAG: amino acid ABC transporter permease [Cardiobacteriaceae bacterium]|nr:amino acid ABC transporter permease [Cardiobacteriaceae bacterium]